MKLKITPAVIDFVAQFQPTINDNTIEIIKGEENDE